MRKGSMFHPSLEYPKPPPRRSVFHVLVIPPFSSLPTFTHVTRPIVQRCLLSVFRYVFCDGGGVGGGSVGGGGDEGGGGGGGGSGGRWWPVVAMVVFVVVVS